MTPLDREIESAVALVIDGNPTSRSILAAQLRDLGVGDVVQASRLADGRRRLESRRFDIVVCEQRFPGDEQSGQALLDDLRRSQLLPHATVFVMITGEARYEQVAEAAESALDSYVIKPYSAATLEERLRQARQRKRALRPIFEAIEADDSLRAAGLCQRHFRARNEFWLYAARIGAELLLRAGHPANAQALFEEVLAARPVAWARLGVARAQAEAGLTGAALRTLQALLTEDPGYADAVEQMGRVQIDLGRFDEALATCRKAAELTPGSISRLQRRGMLAFHLGEHGEAEEQLDRATRLGIGSKMYDPQSLVLLAFARYLRRDGKGLLRCLENLAHLATREGAGANLERARQAVAVLERLLGGDGAGAQQALSDLVAQRQEPELEVEAACNLLWLAATMAQAGVEVDGAPAWGLELALRFSVSRSSHELLSRAAGAHAALAEAVAQGHAEVARLTESAMSHALDHRPTDAVRELLGHTRRTLNAKLADTAQRTLARHRDDVEDADALAQELAALRRRHGRAWAPARLGQGTRAAGALTLREGGPAAPRTGSPARGAALAA